ncbi:hypothetical protein BGZ65_006691, partial [Modicella reniformis]
MLTKLYQRLSQDIEKHHFLLMMLQYSVAVIHGFTVYLLSVILSIAQLIMITATIENLEWVQTYKPLMCEWNSHLPGFVFPTQDIESDSEDDSSEGSKQPYSGCKDRRYWASKTTLKAGDELVDDGYYSEENQRLLSIKQSMNSKCHDLIPSSWVAESEEAEGDRDRANQFDKDNSDTVEHALAKSFSGILRPSKGRRVTFNEQVQVLGRRRSSQADHASSTDIPPVTPKYGATYPSLPPVGGDVLDILAQEEEAEYQHRMASEDINCSGTSSPLFQAEPQQTSISPPHSEASSPPSSILASSIPADEADNMRDFKRASSIPLKLQSLLHRNHKSSSRRSATFSEPSVSLNPKQSSLSEQEQGTSSALTPLSFGIRAKRSFSLVLHGDGDSMSMDRDGSVGRKNKNLVYKIVHPQRYKRELEHQLSEQEHQRLLTILQLQHRHLLESGDKTTSETVSHTLAPIRGQDTALCGNAYYYATSAEYVEGL